MNLENNKVLNLTENELQDLEKTENKKIIVEIKDELTLEEKMAIKCLENIKEPFIMIDLKAVADDLKISDSSAYKLFRRDDFPAINIGKKNQVMLLPYILWKMKRKN